MEAVTEMRVIMQMSPLHRPRGVVVDLGLGAGPGHEEKSLYFYMSPPLFDLLQIYIFICF